MARDYPGRSTDDSAPDDERIATKTINRRSYLKMAGATAMVGTAAGAASAASGGYDTITASGQTIRIDSGETWENKLIDLGTRNSITIVAKGTDWTIRNIGFTGEVGYDDTLFAVADTGNGTSRMENIYFDECPSGRPTGGNYRAKCIWVDPDHSGALEVTNVNFSANGNNAIYGSAPGSNSGGNRGTIHIDGCYCYNPNHTGYRISDNGDSVRNSVVDGNSGRSIWVWECPDGGSGAMIENVQMTDTDDIVIRDNARVETSNVTFPSSVSVPDGCPKSAEEAASGGSAGGSSSSPTNNQGGSEDATLPENTLTVTGTGEPTEYYVETTDELVDDPNAGPLESHDSIDGTSATGWVTNTSHVDQFRFAGDLHEVTFRQGSAHVEVNGETIDPDQYNGDQPTLENTLLVDGVGTSGGTRYEFAVSGAAEKATVKGATIDSEDTVDGGTITGSVAGWRDAFRFGGELTDLTLDGDARVYVNGEQVDPADYGDEQPHVLTLVGNGSSASYEITVDGTIDTVAGDASEDHATVLSDTTVEGSIERGAQRFRFSGALTDVTFHDGSAHVYLDDERIDPDDYNGQERLPHAIVIDGSGTDGQSSYSFAVDGDVVTASYRDASVDPGDAVDGTSVNGSVDDELDAYWFDGNITDFRLNGDASVDVQYNV